MLGFEATTDIYNGLKKTIEWYEKNRKWWERLIPFRKVPLRLKDGRIAIGELLKKLFTFVVLIY